MLIIALVTLTGCMNVNYEVKLNEDGSAEISYLLGYDKSFLSSMGVSTEDLKNDETIANMQETVKMKAIQQSNMKMTIHMDSKP